MSASATTSSSTPLLADRLIGDPARQLLPGERPDPAWVAAATTARPQRPVDDAIQRKCGCSAGPEAHMYPVGRPAGIPLVHGVQVIVLHPPRGSY